MNCFESGNTYLVCSNKGWYVVHQISVEDWVATLFNYTNVESLDYQRHYKGDGVSLYNKIKQQTPNDFYVYMIRDTIDMRQKMINILEYGHLEKDVL